MEVGEQARPGGLRRHKIILAIVVFRTSCGRAVGEEGLREWQGATLGLQRGAAELGLHLESQQSTLP